jgi:hypothetical protein
MPQVSSFVLCRDAFEFIDGVTLWRAFIAGEGPIRQLWAYSELLWKPVEEDCHFHYEIEDVTGKLVASSTPELLMVKSPRQAVLHQLELKRSLTNGEYFCSLLVNDRVADAKLIKVK